MSDCLELIFAIAGYDRPAFIPWGWDGTQPQPPTDPIFEPKPTVVPPTSIATQYDEPVGFRAVERVRTVEEIPTVSMMHGGMIVQRGDRFIRSIGNWPLTTATIYVVGECDMTDGEILDKWRDQG